MDDCELQLSEYAISLFEKEVDWSAPDAHAAADRVMRRWLHEYINGYLEGGNDRLAVYRDTPTPVPVAAEFKTLVDNSASLATYPELKRYLLDYPKATLPAVHTFFYWQEASFGLKRTIHLSHVTIAERPHETVVMSKMLYATHYFWTALDIRVLVPDPARGHGVLVRDREPQPARWPGRVHRVLRAPARAQSGPGGRDENSHDDQAHAGRRKARDPQPLHTPSAPACVRGFRTGAELDAGVRARDEPRGDRRLGW